MSRAARRALIALASAGLAVVALLAFYAAMSWGQPGSLGPQGRRYYYEGGPTVRIRDGGTAATEAASARRNLGVPAKFGPDSIPAAWRLNGSLITPWLLMRDSLTRFVDDVDTTKRLDFHLEGISASTTRHVTWPDRSGEVPASGTLGCVPGCLANTHAAVSASC